MPSRRALRQAGFSLIELTVATAIYSMGLGSLSLMMMVAVHGTSEAGHEEVATLQAASLAELILMNSGAAGHYVGDIAGDPPDCDGGLACAPEDMAAWILDNWRQDLADALPAGTGLVCLDGTPADGAPDDSACDGGGGPVVKVLWRTPEGVDDAEPGVARQIARLPVP
jgi:type IV pilus assembly protein PilV